MIQLNAFLFGSVALSLEFLGNDDLKRTTIFFILVVAFAGIASCMFTIRSVNAAFDSIVELRRLWVSRFEPHTIPVSDTQLSGWRLQMGKALGVVSHSADEKIDKRRTAMTMPFITGGGPGGGIASRGRSMTTRLTNVLCSIWITIAVAAIWSFFGFDLPFGLEWPSSNMDAPSGVT